jgi:hypothetical protein
MNINILSLNQWEIKNRNEEISKVLFSFIDDWFITEYIEENYFREEMSLHEFFEKD